MEKETLNNQGTAHLRQTDVSGSFFTPEFEKEAKKMQSLMSDITLKIKEQANEALWSFFEPYLRGAGIKGEITKGKIKWRGIKLKVQNDLGSIKYQLSQRGVDISPLLTVEFGPPLNFGELIIHETTKQLIYKRNCIL